MKSFVCLAPLLALAGCGTSSTGAEGGPLDVATYDRLAVSATSTLESYRSATASMSTGARCSSAVGAYGPAMRGDLDQMRGMAGAMDTQMRNMGQPSAADMECGMGVMEGELQRHLGVACTSVDMAANRAEAAQHFAVMEPALEHMQMRTAEMTAMMNSSGGMMGQGMGPGMMDGGWRMPDGGMMSWNHQIPGCGEADGGSGLMTDGGWAPMMDGGMP
jgi:hypothetical protein